MFQRTIGSVKAVDDITFEVRRGETLGLVGESGCGKSTTGRAVIRLREPTAGTVLFDGVGPEQARQERSSAGCGAGCRSSSRTRTASLDPRMTVSSIISEPIETHDLKKGKAKRERVAELLEMVGLDPRYVNRYPHEFSGGQRQRIGVARALAVEPEFIVCDEPISALDVSIQAQVLNLLTDLREPPRPDVPVHRPRPVRGQARQRPRGGDVPGQDRRARRRPTRSTPGPATRTRGRCSRRCRCPTRQPSGGASASSCAATSRRPVNPPSGCRFHTRCWLYERLGKPENCRTDDPPLRVLQGDHRAACHYAEEALKTDVGIAHVDGYPSSARHAGAALPFAKKPEAAHLMAPITAGEADARASKGSTIPRRSSQVHRMTAHADEQRADHRPERGARAPGRDAANSDAHRAARRAPDPS